MAVADKKETTRAYQVYQRAAGVFIRDTSGWEKDVNLPDKFGRTAMHYAASAGNETALTRLIEGELSVDFHAKDAKGNTPLIAAVKKAQAPVSPVEVLLRARAKAKINERNQLGRTALSYAVEHGNIPMMDMLLQHGADMDVPDNAGKITVFYAAKSGNTEVLEWLKKHKTYTAFLREQDEKGRTALFEVDNNHEETVNWLVRNDVLIERRDNSGDTPLLYAATHGKVALLQALIKANASIDVEDVRGFSAVMLAAAHGQVLILDALIEAGAIIKSKHVSSGETAAILAAKNNHVDALELLIFSKADITSCAKNGDTALLAAAKKDNEAVVNLLVKHYVEKNTDVVDELAKASEEVFGRILMSYRENKHIAALKERIKERSLSRNDKYNVMFNAITQWQVKNRKTPVADTAVSTISTPKLEMKKSGSALTGVNVTALKASLGGLLAKVSEKVKGAAVSASSASSEMVAPSASQVQAPSAALPVPDDGEMPGLEDPTNPHLDFFGAPAPGQGSTPPA